MMPGADLPRSVRFANYELDTHTGELRAENQRVHLQEQPLQILMMLIERAGDVVTREELHKALWPGSSFGDLEDSLNHAVRRLREALGDTTEKARLIETVPRRGYRFIAKVESLTAVGAGLVPAQQGRPRGAPLRRWAIALAGVATVAAVLFALNIVGLRARLMTLAGARHGVPVPKIESIAVLPLENLSHDPEQEYFADGLTEELITDLGKISALRVISRTSVMQYKGTKKPLPEIARELNVDAVLEGTVARSGGRVRITANLLHAATDRHLWAETYERDLRDVLALQDEVAGAIADQVRIRLTPEERARFAPARPVNPEAHDAYLKGRYYWNLRTEEGLKKSIDYFQQAIQKDPSYPLAYAGLADSYAVSVMWGSAPPREAYPRAKAAALKALEMDDTLAEPHATLGVAKTDFDFDFVGAEKELKLAIKLNPSYASAHEWYAAYLTFMGRSNEAFPEIKRAQELDPLSPSISVMGGFVLLSARRYNEAVAECQRTLQLKPDFYPAHFYLGEVYEQQKLYAQAIAEYQKALALEPGNSIVGTALACGYAAAGKRTEALKKVSQLKELSRRRYVSPYGIACIYAALGDVDQACAWLERAYEDRSYGLYSLKVNPRFGTLRSTPRFQALLRRMNFPP